MKKLITCISILVLLTACGPGQALGPTLTPVPSSTPAPTLTPTPTPSQEELFEISLGQLCNRSILKNADLEIISEPILPMIKLDYAGGWEISSINPIDEASIREAQTIACIMQSREKIGIYKDQKNGDFLGNAYRVHWLVKFVDISSEDVIGEIKLFGGNPPSELIGGGGDEYGSAPNEKFLDLVYSFSYKENSSCKILFSSNRDGDMEIFNMDPDGGNVQQLTFNEVQDTIPAWSPDGSKILFSSLINGDEELFIMNSDGNNIEQLTFNKNREISPQWVSGESLVTETSDFDMEEQELSSKIVYCLEQDDIGQIFTIDPETKEIQELIEIEEDMETFSIPFSLSPIDDIGKIAYTININNNFYENYLYTMNIDGTNKSQIAFQRRYIDVGLISWSKDAMRIAFSAEVGNGDWNIYTTELGLDDFTQLTFDEKFDFLPSWSFDDQQMIFVSDRDGDFEIYSQIVNGSDKLLKQLTHNDSHEASPSWSPLCK